MTWWIKLLRLAACVMLADLTEPAREPICACPGCDGCESTLPPHPCSQRPVGSERDAWPSGHYCAACATEGRS